MSLTVRHVETGEERVLRGRYLIGADGAHSRVRDAAGHRAHGAAGVLELHHDLLHGRPVAAGCRAARQHRLREEPGAQRVLPDEPRADVGLPGHQHHRRSGRRPRGRGQRRRRHPRSDADRATFARASACRTSPVRIDGVSRWRATAEVASRFRAGRVFLAGDAAHVMPPNGGFGGNTGIHDAHNLAWKLALCLERARRRRAAGLLRRRAAAGGRTSPSSRPSRGTSPEARRGCRSLLRWRRWPRTSTSRLATCIARARSLAERGRPDRPHRSAHVMRGARHAIAARLGGASTASACPRWTSRSSFVLIAGPQGGRWCDAARAIASPAVDAYPSGTT